MKNALLIGLASLLWFSSPSAKAANLITAAGWVKEGGDVTIVSGTLNIGIGGDYGEVLQTFATVPGTTYVLQYNLKTTDEALASFLADVTGTSALISNAADASPSGVPTTFTAQVAVFTADSTVTTLEFMGSYITLNNVSVTAGSFTKPGKYTGTAVVTQTLTAATIAGAHTDTVVARVTASGGVSILDEPFGTYYSGCFLSGTSIALSGKTSAATLSGDALKFTVISAYPPAYDASGSGATAPQSTNSAYALTWISN